MITICETHRTMPYTYCYIGISYKSSLLLTNLQIKMTIETKNTTNPSTLTLTQQHYVYAGFRLCQMPC